jgi:hypothetical protein
MKMYHEDGREITVDHEQVAVFEKHDFSRTKPEGFDAKVAEAKAALSEKDEEVEKPKAKSGKAKADPNKDSGVDLGNSKD